MKKSITASLCLALVLALTFTGCGAKTTGSGSPTAGGADMPDSIETVDTETEKTQDAVIEKDTDTDDQLVEIVDRTEVDHLGTDDELEEFFKDDDYTYYFPSIKSAYIECRFSDGEILTITEALECGKVTVSDLDTYGILYWIVDKDGNYINSLQK